MPAFTEEIVEVGGVGVHTRRLGGNAGIRRHRILPETQTLKIRIL